MRVAHVCKTFSRPSETFIYDLVTGLARSGCESVVLTGARLLERERPLESVRVLPEPPLQRAWFAFRKEVMHVYDYRIPRAAYARELRAFRPDLVVAHYGGTGAAVRRVTGELGLPLVVIFHAFDLFTRNFHPGSYTALWRNLARAVAISERGRETLEARYGCPPDKLRVIHCGVDVAAFAPRASPRSAGPVAIASVGRLVEKKGTADLLRAAASARARTGEDLRIDVYGEGPLRERLGRLAGELGLRAATVFHGRLPRERVPEALGRADLYALPSRTARNGDREGLPVTILEAQAAGLPVLSTLHSGIPEALPPEHHRFLAREGDAADLADKLVALLAARGRWQDMGARGRAWIERRFSLAAEVRAYLRLFEEILAAGRAR